jgi:signal transduction histidine kinase/HAMP domain-containing protein
MTVEDPAASRDREPGSSERSGSGRLSLRTRLTLALIVATLLPLLGLGLLLFATGAGGSGAPGSPIDRVVLAAIAAAGFAGIVLALLFASTLLQPLRAVVTAVERVSDGDRRTRIEVPGDDELALLADRYNRLVEDLDRRDRSLGRVRSQIAALDPSAGRDRLLGQAADGVRAAFEMTSAEIVLGDPDDLPVSERVPGEPVPVRSVLRLGYDEVGVFVGTLAPTRSWEAADQMLLDLFAAEVAFAIRNAELIDQVERQNAGLRSLDAAKDEFLRGVSHNLQTPLASITAATQQLGTERPDRRLELIEEQARRLSRMVRQLVTVSRLESDSLRPKAEVLSLASRAGRAWDALGASEVPFTLHDAAEGWLAVADPDQLDQVLWALLDNAVRHGGGKPVEVRITADQAAGQLRMTVGDEGPGIAESDRGRLFARYERLGATGQSDGTGLGLYVSRELCRAMRGDLVLEPAESGRGAAFTIILPAEVPGSE